MFVEEYLRDLRRERFAPGALARYSRSIAARIREDIDAAPSAVRSVWTVALGFFAAAFVAAAGIALAHDRGLASELFLHTSLWVLIAFTVVTLSIGSLRDATGCRISALNVPITLTLMRVVLVPAIALLLLDRHYAAALFVFIVAALSDVVDGAIARRWNQITQLGTILDPIVDIVFNLALFAALALAGLLPWWVLGVAAVRYGVLLVGGACLYLFVGPVRIRPTLSGRLTGVLMSALVGFLMLLHVLGSRWSDTLATLTQSAIGLLSGATVLQALALGWYNLRLMRGALPATGRVVGDVRWGTR
jgi:cardiolipin synthase